jgi:hypothetical protein
MDFRHTFVDYVSHHRPDLEEYHPILTYSFFKSVETCYDVMYQFMGEMDIGEMDSPNYVVEDGLFGQFEMYYRSFAECITKKKTYRPLQVT